MHVSQNDFLGIAFDRNKHKTLRITYLLRTFIDITGTMLSIVSEFMFDDVACYSIDLFDGWDNILLFSTMPMIYEW